MSPFTSSQATINYRTGDAAPYLYSGRRGDNKNNCDHLLHECTCSIKDLEVRLKGLGLDLTALGQIIMVDIDQARGHVGS